MAGGQLMKLLTIAQLQLVFQVAQEFVSAGQIVKVLTA